MKVAQNDETNPDAQPVRPPHILSIANSQLSLSGSSVRKRETTGILSRMFSPFTGIASYRVRAYLASRIASLCFVMLCLLRIYCFFPHLLLRQTMRPTLLLPSSTTVLTTPLSCQSNQASPPFDHQISPIPISTTCIRVVQHVTILIDPILLHSLPLLLPLLIPYLQS